MKQQSYILLVLSIMLFGGIAQKSKAAPSQYISTDSLWQQVKKHYKSSPDLALQFAEALQKEANSNHDSEKEAHALWSIAYINYEKGNLNESVTAYFKVIPLYKSLGNTKYVGKVYYNIGKILTDTKNNVSAAEYYHKALDIYTTLNDNEWIANTNLQLGLTYVNLKEYDKAETYLHMVLQLAEGHNKKIIHRIYNWLGVSELNKGNYDKAIAHFNTSVKYSDEENDPSEKAAVLLNIGVAHSLNGNLKVAKEFAAKALALSVHIKDIDKQVKPQILLSEIAIKQTGNNTKELKNLMATIRATKTGHYNAYLQEALYFVSEKPQQDVLVNSELKEMMGMLAEQGKISGALYEKTKTLLNQHSIQLSIEKVKSAQKVEALKEKNDLLRWGSVVAIVLFLFILGWIVKVAKYKKRLKEKAYEAQLKKSENRIESVIKEIRNLKITNRAMNKELEENATQNVFLVKKAKGLEEEVEAFGDEFLELTDRLAQSKHTMHEMSVYVWNMIKDVSRQGFKIPPPPPWDLGSERDN